MDEADHEDDDMAIWKMKTMDSDEDMDEADHEDDMMMALPDLEGQTVTVAVENAYPPFNFIDSETGEAVGWDYDVINAICDTINCVAEFIETSWEGMIVAVSNGEFDMAADGITITEERGEIVDFGIGYARIIQRLLVSADEDRFSNADEFVEGDYTLAAQLATTNYLTGEELVGTDRIVGFTDFGAAIQAVIAGDADAVIIDDVAGQGYVGENADAVQLLDDEIKSTESLGFIFEKDSELTAAFDAGLLALAESGVLDAINEVHGFEPFVGAEDDM